MKRPQLLLSSCMALALVAGFSTSQTASAAGVGITDTIAPTTDLILPFGAVAIGKSSPVQTITIKNQEPSGSVVNITVPPLQLSSSAFILDPNGGGTPCGSVTTLSPQAFCTLTVIFQPNVTGSHSAFLNIINISDLGGERIAFHDPSTGGISLFGVTASDITTVTDPPLGVEDLNPSWSPGQGQIVFHRRDDIALTDTLLRINIDGTGETFVANNGKTPSWSPDGQRIAYRNTTSNAGIKLVDLNLNLLDEFGNVGTGNFRSPSWSLPTGEELVFSFGPFGTFQGIAKINTNGSGAQTDITTDGGRTPSWSPDGQKIAFQARFGFPMGGISTIDSEGLETPLPLTLEISGVNDKNPSWSTDGTQIVFHRETATENKLFIISSTGVSTPTIPLTDGKTPAWSPSNEVSISFLGTGLAVNTNSPPTAPQLTLPTVNQMNVTVPVTFKWLSSSDPDGDPITYDLLVCPSVVFPAGTGCITESSVGVQSSQKPMTSAGIWLSGGSLLFGIAFSGRRRLRHQTTRRSIWSSFFLLTIMVIGLNACGGGGGTTITPGGGGSGTTGVELTHTVDNLAPGTSFTWQVTARDNHGGATPSVARSFKTAQ